MVFKIELPHVGESVTEAIIGKWLKSPGDHIDKYDSLVEVITDKVNMDVPAPATGTLTKILAPEGDTVPMGSVIAEMETDEAVVEADSASPAAPATSAAANPAASPLAGRIGTLVQGANVGPTGGEFLDASLSSPTDGTATTSGTSGAPSQSGYDKARFSTVVTRLAVQHGVDLNSLVGTGLGGRVTKKDVLTAVESGGAGISAAARSAQVLEAL
ncbi:MAG: E3 binding domain-containing protein, partial [Chloroflexi bacterium]|nr:E3 binding domain-containing protein [Chloroflexota bacterium]